MRLPDHDAGIDLIARRADITASRWRVEAGENATADSGARRVLSRRQSSTRLIGVQSIDIGTIASSTAAACRRSSGALHLPIFDSGRLKARNTARRNPAIDSAVASYQETLVDRGARGSRPRPPPARRSPLERSAAAGSRSMPRSRLEAAAAAARVRQGRGRSRATELDRRPNRGSSSATRCCSWMSEALSADIGLQRALGGGYDRTKATTQ